MEESVETKSRSGLLRERTKKSIENKSRKGLQTAEGLSAGEQARAEQGTRLMGHEAGLSRHGKWVRCVREKRMTGPHLRL